MTARLAALAIAFGVASCATISAHDADIFQRPEAYLEQEVRLCGYIRSTFEDNNIWIDRNAWLLREDNDPHVGLGLEPEPFDLLTSKHDNYGCVTGELVRTGCGEEKICTGSNFPYAVAVRAAR